MWRENASNLKFLEAVPPHAITAVVGVDATGNSIFTQNYDSLTFVALIGAAASLASAGATLALRIQHAPNSAGELSAATPGTWADCDSTVVIRYGVSGAMTSGIWGSVDSADYSGTIFQVAYRGSEAFVRVLTEIKTASVSGNTTVGVTAVLGHIAHWPAAVPNT